MARPPIEADPWTRLRIAELAQTIAFERQPNRRTGRIAMLDHQQTDGLPISPPQIGEILSQTHSTVETAQ